MSTIKITDHAKKRVIKRCGLNKSAINKLVKEAFINGITIKNAKSKLKKYMYELSCRSEEVKNIKVHSGFVFLFRQNVLVTCYILPYCLRKYELLNKEK